MADSANVLSILSALGQTSPAADPTQSGNYYPPTDPTNVLQAVAPAQTPAPILDVPAAPPVSLPAPPAAPSAPAVSEDHPRKRQSAIDVIGRLADVFAKVGGAEALYQPTLDSREDRTLALGDHARQVDMDALRKSLLGQQVSEGELEPILAERKRLGTALGALANNPDAANLWPSVAAQAGITDPQKVAAIGQVLQQNPGSAGIFAKALGADIDNLGKNVYFGTDPQGKTVAYQVGPDGNPHILDFSASGITPSDPIKVVDTGGAQVVVGSSGNPRRILPKTARPDTIITTQAQRDIAAGHDRTQVQIAGMPARAKAPVDNSAFITTAQGNLDELRGIYSDLKKMGAMVSPSQSTGQNAEARARASGLGQMVEGAVGTKAQTLRDRANSIRPQLMQALAKATGMGSKQLDSNSDVRLFMQTVTNPTSSYEANLKAIDGLERFLKANAKKPTAAAPAKSSGWSIVGVK